MFCIAASPRQPAPPAAQSPACLMCVWIRLIHTHISRFGSDYSENEIMWLDKVTEIKGDRGMNSRGSQMMVLTSMIQTCPPSCLWNAKTTWFMEEAHNPNKQVNTPPTQQPFSASLLLVLLFPSGWNFFAFALSALLTFVRVFAHCAICPVFVKSAYRRELLWSFWCVSYVVLQYRTKCNHQYLITSPTHSKPLDQWILAAL